MAPTVSRSKSLPTPPSRATSSCSASENRPARACLAHRYYLHVVSCWSPWQESVDRVNLIDLAVALAAGLISITSPCCLPLLPGYLGYLSGMSTAEMAASRRRPVVAALLFVAGFTAAFATLGATASALGEAVRRARRRAGRVAGGFHRGVGLG